MKISKLWLLATSSVLALNGVAFAAQGQPTDVEEVIVTGSRIVREGFNAPTPLTVINIEQVQAYAASNIVDFITTMPVFQGGNTPSNTQSGLTSGWSGASQLNLRRLGILRTLVLLDGQRTVGSTFDNAVDINTFPQGLLQRVDVVTGGASAVYGSDAVSGVVNFILDKEFSGVKGELSGGITNYSDNEDYIIRLTSGFAFGGGRGHFLAAGEQVDKAGVEGNDARPWGLDNLANVINPNYTASNGQPNLLLLPNVGFQNAYPGGIITAGPLKGIAFGPAGNPFPFEYGPIVSQNVMSGGAWRTTFTQPFAGNSLDLSESRQSVFLRSSYEVTDGLNLYAQAQYASSATFTRTIPYLRAGNITVKADNAYIPGQIRTQMGALGLTQLAMGSLNGDLPSTGSNNARVLNRFVAGGDGNFALFGKDWKYNFYYTYGKVRNSVDSYSLVNATRYNQAIDAVPGPNGKIVCRSTLTAPSNGCVPYNLFGEGVNNQQVKNYILGNAHINFDNVQQVQEATITGPLFDIWAGPVSTAISITHRTEKTFGKTDAESSRSEYFTSNFAAINAQYGVTEGAVEFDIPLAKDVSWAQSLDANIAARITDYTVSGTIATWKIGGSYQPIPDVRVRANRSRDIRAPVLQEFYQPIVSAGVNDLLDPFTGKRGLVFSPQGGNPVLMPEKADTTEIGVVLQPSFVPGLSLSADYWQIKVKDAITILGAQQILDVCYTLQQNCQVITRVNGVATQVDRIPVNLSVEDARGMDFEATYGFAASTLISALPGDLILHANATWYLKDYLTSPITAPNELSGSLALPTWRYAMTASWTNDPVNVTVFARGTSSMNIDNNRVQCTSACPTSTPINQTVNINRVHGVFHLDASATYKLDLFDATQTDLFFNVRNILDADPPYVGGANIQQVPTISRIYDTLGRTYRLGIRFKT